MVRFRTILASLGAVTLTGAALVSDLQRRPWLGLADHHRQPEHHVPVDDRLRRLVHRLVGLAGRQLVAAQHDHDQAVRPQLRHRAGLPAPADRRVRLRPLGLQLRRHGRGHLADQLLDRPRHPGRSVATFTWTPSSGGTTGPPSTIDSTKWYSVANANSSKCLDATGGSTANGTALQQWTCTAGATNQQWQFQPTDSGFSKVVARSATTQAWDLTGGSGATGNGVKVQLWAYGGGTNQQWQAVAHSDGTYSFSPRNNTGNCLDVTDVSTADGALLQQWACSGGPAQSFRLTAHN